MLSRERSVSVKVGEEYEEGKAIVNKRNSRASERSLSNALVKLKWNGTSGELRFAPGKVLDCSESGIRIEVAEPIQIRSYITLDAPELNMAGWAGWGSVRYCVARRSKYVIGLELSAGARWN
jgi:hypothetical protein